MLRLERGSAKEPVPLHRASAPTHTCRASKRCWSTHAGNLASADGRYPAIVRRCRRLHRAPRARSPTRATVLTWVGEPVQPFASGPLRVHALPDRFGSRSRTALTDAWKAAPGTVLLQYVPNALGHRGMNVAFCRWLLAERQAGRDVRVMFHEPYSISPRLVHGAMLPPSRSASRPPSSSGLAGVLLVGELACVPGTLWRGPRRNRPADFLRPFRPACGPWT